MGNPILRDDAVGIRLAADIGQRLGKVSGLDVVTGCSAGGLELLSVIQGYARLIVFDSIKTEGGTPGAWYRFTAADLQETMNLTNVHDTNFATALELGRRLGQDVPAADMSHIFAVEILDNGPNITGRMLDLSMAAANQLQMVHRGIVWTRIAPAIGKPGKGD